MIVVQDSIVASSPFSSNGNWSLISVASNSSASTYQQSGTSSYPSFNETLSNLQAEMEPEFQNGTGNGNTAGSQPFQSETFQPSVSATEQPYYGNPALTNSATSNFANWRTNSQGGPSNGGSADSANRVSANGSPQQPQLTNNSQPPLTVSTNSTSGSGKAQRGDAASGRDAIEDGNGQAKLTDSSGNALDRPQTAAGNPPDEPDQDSLKQSSPAVGESDNGNASAGLDSASKPFARSAASTAKPEADGGALVQSVSRDLRLAGGEKAGSSTPAEVEVHLPGSQSADKSKPGKSAAAGKATTNRETSVGDPSVSIAEAAIDFSSGTLALTPKTSAGTAEPGNSAISSVTPSPRGSVKGKDSNVDLAFAVKVEANAPSASDSTTSSDLAPAPSLIADGVPSNPFLSELKTLLASSGQGGNENRGSGDGAVPAVTLAPASPVASAPSNSSTRADTPVPQQDAAAAAEGVQDKVADFQTPKSVQIRVTGDDNQQVDLRLMQRSGALTVSVRSTDTSLTKALQQNLPDLNNKLNDQQVRTEWWTPGASQLQSSQKTNESSANPGSGHSGSQNQGDQNKGNASQQDGRGAPKPDWVEQLSDFSNSNQNGKQYSWHL